MNIKVGNVYKIDGEFYVVTRVINKPYSIVKLHSVNEDKERIIPIPQLLKILKEMEEEVDE